MTSPVLVRVVGGTPPRAALRPAALTRPAVGRPDRPPGVGPLSGARRSSADHHAVRPPAAPGAPSRPPLGPGGAPHLPGRLGARRAGGGAQRRVQGLPGPRTPEPKAPERPPGSSAVAQRRRREPARHSPGRPPGVGQPPTSPSRHRSTRTEEPQP
ncbi:hypothetical protein GCM10010393_52120 [Streptomyces gobitricini]|uniref:Uncharacterized protein n=1 Tax=Streptomyces gobitricini TaxID=68211 RepID=A0ABP6A978_9ACTN